MTPTGARAASPGRAGAGTYPDEGFVLVMTWKDHELLLALRGDGAGVRVYSLDGSVERMRRAPEPD